MSDHLKIRSSAYVRWTQNQPLPVLPFLMYFQQFWYLPDYIIAEKEKEIEILSEQIKRLNEAKEQGENGEIVEIPAYTKPEEKIVYDIPTPEFRESGFFKNYKGLNKEFDVDSEQLIKDFIKIHENDDDKEYKELQSFKELFTQNAIYELSLIHI